MPTALHISPAQSVATYLFSGCLLLVMGCYAEQQTQKPPPAVDPLQAMQTAIETGDWKSAGELSPSVLIEHGDDPQVLAQVARVAHENQQLDKAASLLVDSARAGSLSDPTAVLRAMTGLIAVGRVFDGIDLMSEAVERHPDQDATRRFLFDFLVIFEKHPAAVPHGQMLVRKRKFDFDMLLMLSNTEERQLENDSLEQLVSRKLDDKRPRIGDAKFKFDLGRLTEVEKLLLEILDSHPDFVPAQILLGRTLADSGQFEALPEWSNRLSGDFQDYWAYWSVLGDWARFRGQTAQSARAYWEATRRNPDVMLVWSKLGAALIQLQSSGTKLPDDFLAKVTRRAAWLSRIVHHKDLFIRSKRKSQKDAEEISRALLELGRLWEAEAWTAMAMTIPDGDSASLETTRNEIVSQMRRDTPWQSMDQHPELTLDLSYLAAPSLEQLAQSPTTGATRIQAVSVTPQLRDEAITRSLRFFGRTAANLDQPGVLIYAELGCGGGSLDYDLDGWSDLYLVAAGGTPRAEDSESNVLMRNLNGYFHDATESAAVGDTGFGQGVAVGDVNEDGFPDLLVLNYGVNRLLVNNGDGSFRTVGEKDFPQSAPKWSTSGAIADLDGDGISDIYIANYCAGFSPVTLKCTNEETGVTRSCAPIRFDGEPDDLLKGSLNGSFVNVTDDWNIKPIIVGRGLGVVIGSLDDHLGLDVFVTNDMTDNHFWIPTAKGSGDGPSRDRFSLSESAMSRGLAGDDRANPQGSMGIAIADFDNDFDFDFYVTNFEKEYHTYHRQVSNGVWRDTTTQERLATMTLAMVGFGTQAVDFDNDGNLELVVSNGHVDFPTGPDSSPYEQPMQIFRRTTEANFELTSGYPADSYLGRRHVGRALWTLDANRDGQTDLVVTHQTEPVALLINHTRPTGHWIGLHLRGTTCARDAIGTVVELVAGDRKSIAQLTSGDGYLCSNERVIRFGLGEIQTGISIKVRWPDGTTQTHYDLTTDTDWILVQHAPPFRLSAADAVTAPGRSRSASAE
jgi:tetratricopeptide (TPR) repeat protein